MNVLALLVPGFLRLGHLHMPVFGFFAAAGLVAAIWFSQRTAEIAKLPTDKLWDTSIFAVVTAFVVSRLLLVLEHLSAFSEHPLLVLSLPSLTYSGLLLTVVLTCVWMQWRRLPQLRAMDAWAPCGALLWTALSLGHFVEGTDAGMPTELPWGVVSVGDTVLGPTHPAQIYTAIAAAVLFFVLMRRLRLRGRAGEVAALGLMAGGAISFLLGMLRQPTDTYSDAWLDPSQWAALGAFAAGAFIAGPLLWNAVNSAHRMEQFLEDFVMLRGEMRVGWMRRTVFLDPLLIEIQERFFRLPKEYPTDSVYYPWCNEDGLQVLKWYVYQLHSRNDEAAGKEH